MLEAIVPTHLAGSRRAQLLAVTALVSGFLVAGCGGTSHSPTAAPASGASTSASSTTTTRALTTPVSGAGTAGGAANSGSAASSAAPPAALAFATCMRSNGVPNFPDPEPGGSFEFPANGPNPSSPAFKAARATCQKFLPDGGPPGPGATTHPSAQTLAKLVRIAECMRQHGISQFPDPRTSVPTDLTAYQEITDFDGAILLFPSTINLQSPAYRQDLDACGAPPLGLHH
jgi:hypothetical protein